MKFKTVLNYLLASSMLGIPNATGDFCVESNSLHAQTIKSTTTKQVQIEKKAQELCDAYIDFVLQGQKNIKTNNRHYGHNRSVSRELPGAPQGLYCIYGQYTQLNRALNSLNDTLTLVPYGARNSCPTFRDLMRKKYSGDEYAGALHNGKMFKSWDEYNRALNAYLKHHRVTDDTPIDEKNKVIARFEKNNFCVDVLHPGTILIIQKSANPTNTHAVMYMGRGRIENGEFISDDNGKCIYAGYNNESLDDLFKTFNTNHIFAADIYNIAVVDYSKELQKIQDMDDNELFRFVYDVPNDLYVVGPNREYLEKMAMDKYFNKEDFVPTYPMVSVSTASFPLLPIRNIFTKKLGLTK